MLTKTVIDLFCNLRLKNRFSSRCGISPVVATSLLLVVAVVTVVGFHSWFNAFSNSLLVDVETDTLNSFEIIKFEGIYNNELYLNSKNINDLNKLKLLSQNGTEMCSFSNNEIKDNSDLIGSWDFDFSSDVLIDKSENSNDGNLFGDTRLLLDFDNNEVKDKTGYGDVGNISGATYIDNDCVSGGCFNFDGDDDIIYFPNSRFIDFDENKFSISIWFKLDVNVSDMSEEYPVLFMNRPYLLGGYAGHFYGSTGNLNFQTCVIGNCRSASYGNFNINEWYHYVGILDNSSQRLYINGELVADVPAISEIRLSNYTNLRFGNDFNGSIDEFSIYSKVLDDDEIKNLYNSRKAKFIETNTLDDKNISLPIDFDLDSKTIEIVYTDKLSQSFRTDSVNYTEDYTGSYRQGDTADDGWNKWIDINSFSTDNNYNIWANIEATYCNSSASDSYAFIVNNVSNSPRFNLCDIYGLDSGSTSVDSNFKWLKIKINKFLLISGENKFNFYDLSNHRYSNWRIGTDLTMDFEKSAWGSNSIPACNSAAARDPLRVDEGGCYNEELMVFLTDMDLFSIGEFKVSMSENNIVPQFGNFGKPISFDDKLNSNKKVLHISFNSDNYSLYLNSEFLVSGNYTNSGINDLIIDNFRGTIDSINFYDNFYNNSEIKKLYSNSILELDNGINKINLLSCNLNKGERYDIISSTNRGLFEDTVIIK